MDGHSIGGNGDARLKLSLAALGVVFGDIGTSPLYALRACFTDVAGISITPDSVLGVLSLIFWSLALVVSVKYVSLVLRADNRGEGGVLALTALVLSEAPHARAGLLAALGLAGCALFFGDGAITPAISVLSAIEGLNIATPALEHSVVPLSLLALLGLFWLQKRGTGAVGGLFGPVMATWFFTLAALGVAAIARQPLVLQAINPAYAVDYLAGHAAVATAVLGAVFLAVTGGEALYADLGHFGRAPISRAWFFMVWPCLVLNYFGQGALLLSRPGAVENPFYLLAPDWLLIPLVLLATAATVIASQAVISGVFSIAQQCQQLGYLPRLKVEHSSEEAMGQVYVPAINWMLCMVTLGLVAAFGSSTSLANAYGIAVAGTMAIVTVLMIVLVLNREGRATRIEAGLLVALGIVDAGFVAANLVKAPHGGWFPLVFGAAIFLLMRTWERGRAAVSTQVAREERTVESLLAYLQRNPPVSVPGCAVFMSSNASGIPRTLIRNLRHNGALHEHTVIMTVAVERVPHVMTGNRIKVTLLAPGLHRVVAHVGFMEQPNVPKLLREAERHGLEFRTDRATYVLGREDVVIGFPRGMALWRKHLFLFLSRNAQFAGAHFGIAPERVMEVGGQVQI